MGAVYDVTIGYPTSIPQNEADILKGKVDFERIFTKFSVYSEKFLSIFLLRFIFSFCITYAL